MASINTFNSNSVSSLQGSQTETSRKRSRAEISSDSLHSGVVRNDPAESSSKKQKTDGVDQERIISEVFSTLFSFLSQEDKSNFTLLNRKWVDKTIATARITLNRHLEEFWEVCEEVSRDLQLGCSDLVQIQDQYLKSYIKEITRTLTVELWENKLKEILSKRPPSVDVGMGTNNLKEIDKITGVLVFAFFKHCFQYRFDSKDGESELDLYTRLEASVSKDNPFRMIFKYEIMRQDFDRYCQDPENSKDALLLLLEEDIGLEANYPHYLGFLDGDQCELPSDIVNKLYPILAYDDPRKFRLVEKMMYQSDYGDIALDMMGYFFSKRDFDKVLELLLPFMGIPDGGQATNFNEDVLEYKINNYDEAALIFFEQDPNMDHVLKVMEEILSKGFDFLTGEEFYKKMCAIDFNKTLEVAQQLPNLNKIEAFIHAVIDYLKGLLADGILSRGVQVNTQKIFNFAVKIINLDLRSKMLATLSHVLIFKKRDIKNSVIVAQHIPDPEMQSNALKHIILAVVEWRKNYTNPECIKWAVKSVMEIPSPSIQREVLGRIALMPVSAEVKSQLALKITYRHCFEMDLHEDLKSQSLDFSNEHSRMSQKEHVGRGVAVVSSNLDASIESSLRKIKPLMGRTHLWDQSLEGAKSWALEASGKHQGLALRAIGRCVMKRSSRLMA